MFIDLLISALPYPAQWPEIESLFPKGSWESAPLETAKNAFSTWGKLDAEDYLLRYPDVKVAGVDPIAHFMDFGLDENRFIRIKGSRKVLGLCNREYRTRPTKMEFKEGIFDPSSSSDLNVLEIAYICDRSYLFPTFVSIYSLYLHRKPEVFYDIHLIAVDIDREEIEKIKLIESDRFRIDIIHKLDIYSNCVFDNKNIHVSNAAVYKLLLAELLPASDKVLYLDCDTLVLNSLTDLLRIDIDPFYVAAVASLPLTYSDISLPAKRLGKNIKYYFNSGVMWLNLKRIRENGIIEEALGYRENGNNIFMDQDALNFAMAGGVAFLDFSYNTMLHQVESRNNSILRGIVTDHARIKSQTDYVVNAKILHYSSRRKPWSANPGKFGYIWQSYADAVSRLLSLPNPASYDSNEVKYNYNRYYYSDMGIQELPGYRDFNITNHMLGPKRYVSTDFSANYHGQLPICLSRDTAPVYVTLTSKPARLSTLYMTLYSLMNQSLRPKGILLWLAEDEFAGKVIVPPEIEGLGAFGLIIKSIPKSLRSYNKLVPALREYPDDILVTCDDDIFYEKNWLGTIYRNWLKQPDSIFSLRPRRAAVGKNGVPLPYNRFRLINETASGYDLIPTGVGGVLYPPHSLHDEVTDSHKFMRYAPTADDLWFWAMSVTGGVRTRATRTGLSRLIYTSVERELEGETLWKSNGRAGGNDAQFFNLWSAYPTLRKALFEAA